MIDEIKLYCKENQLIEPQTEGEIVSCLCNSMVRSYLETIDEIEHISGRKYDTLQIIGGGSRNRFLQNLLKRKCRQQLSIGPLEATACGNLLCQLIACGEIESIEKGRKIL
jgi:rhamnulokinase